MLRVIEGLDVVHDVSTRVMYGRLEYFNKQLIYKLIIMNIIYNSIFVD